MSVHLILAFTDGRVEGRIVDRIRKAYQNCFDHGVNVLVLTDVADPAYGRADIRLGIVNEHFPPELEGFLQMLLDHGQLLSITDTLSPTTFLNLKVAHVYYVGSRDGNSLAFPDGSSILIDRNRVTLV